MYCSIPLRLSPDGVIELLFSEIRRTGTPPEIPESVTLECGGGHRWAARVETEEE